ncbi:ATP-binding cassette domain-containing protein [bacterium]|nr:ATP-binding cassette domain-containing protein [bacterium]
MMIAASGIAKRFAGKPVLRDVSLELRGPGVYALAGPNGSGKTTLMRLLALLLEPDGGEVSFDDHTARSNGDKPRAQSLRRRMALIHNPAVMLSGSVAYNVGYGLGVRRMGKRERGNCVRQILEKLELAGFEKRNARRLSAGETQRVALARAMVLDPEVIFLDEPTANLDPASARLIEGAVREMARAGKQVVVASHNLWQVERIADWLWFLNDGRLTLSGPAADVLHRGDHKVWSEFLGRDNLFNGTISVAAGRSLFVVGPAGIEVVTDLNGPAMASLDPSEIIISREPLRSSARNQLKGIVKSHSSEGGLYKVTLDCGVPLVAAITKASWDEMGLKEGEQVYAVFKASAVRVWREE